MEILTQLESPVLRGNLVGVDSQGNPLVDFDGNLNGPVPASSVVPLTEHDIERQRSIVMLLAVNSESLPVILGVIQDQPVVSCPAIGRLSPRSPLRVSADGQCLNVEAYSEIRLKCGQSSLTLRKDGKIVIQGTNILSRAKMCNRVKGGSVHLN